MIKIKHKLDSKGTKEKIIELFYIKHLKPTEIAKKLKIGMSYITKIIQKDSRYIREKETRRLENKEKNKIQKRIYDQKLLVQINRDNEYLSTKKKENDLQFVNCNRSAYDYDKNSSDLVLKDNINAGYAVPKRVSNIVNPNMIKSKKICV